MQTLDDLFREMNSIYLDANFHKDESQLFAHLIEVIGGLSAIASENPADRAQTIRHYMPKAVAWWLTLAGKVGMTSVMDMMWIKFPGVCPYCRVSPHREEACKGRYPEMKPDWLVLRHRGETHLGEKPRTLAEWQSMFGEIYPPVADAQMELVFGRLVEELGELAETVRVRRVAPRYFISEASDVFAWLMNIQNSYNLDSGSPPTTLTDWLAADYPGHCRDCNLGLCACPSILDSAFGRLSNEVPVEAVPDGLIRLEDTYARFRQRVLVVGDSEYRLKPNDLTGLRNGVTEVLARAFEAGPAGGLLKENFIEALYRLKALNSATQIDADIVDQLHFAMRSLPVAARRELDDMASPFASNLFGFLFTTAISARDRQALN